MIPDKELNDSRNSQLDYGLIYFVDVDTGGGAITFEFSAALRVSDVRDRAHFEEEIAKAIRDVAKLPKPTPRKPEEDPNLSIHSDVNCYLALALDPRKTNWHFARPISGITRITSAMREFEDSSPNYYKLGRMTKDGQALAWDDDTEDCIVAYIEADCATASLDKGGSFVDRFNLYVDIGDQNGTVTPIVIDPDVRYPGGHG